MLKRTLTLSLVVLLVLALAACGGSASQPPAAASSAPAASAAQPAGDAAGEKTVVTLMRWGNAELTEKAAAAALAVNPDLAEQMELEVIIAGPGNAEVAQKCRLALAANEALPDIVQLNYNNMPEFAVAGVLRDLETYWEPYKAAVSPAILNLAQYNDQFVCFPGAPKTKLWFYRTDMFEEAGIVPEDVKTLDDFIAAGQRLSAAFPGSYIDILSTEVGPTTLQSLMSGNGALVCDDDGNYIIASDPNFADCLVALKKLRDSGVMAAYEDFTPEWENALADGTIAAASTFNWYQRYLPGYAPDQAGLWAVAQAPQWANDDGGSDNGADIYVFFENIEHPDLAIEYVTRLRLDKETSLAAKEAIKLTPILNEALADDRMKVPDPFFGTSLYEQDVIAMGKLKVQQCTPSSQRETDIMMPYVSKYVNGEMELQEALDAIQADLVNQIGNAYNPK